MRERFEYTEQIIPAAPGYTLIYVGGDPAEPITPAAEDEVIAWAIVSRVGKIRGADDPAGIIWVNPVTPSGVPDDVTTYVIRRPDGMHEVPEIGTYSTLAEAVTEATRPIGSGTA
jgi:hypothetical protein